MIRQAKLKPVRDDSGEDRHFVTALARGLDILRCFSPERQELGSSELARMVDLPQPTVWRLCRTLAQCGYLVPAGETGKMRLGLPVLALGYAVLASHPVAELARPYMKKISDRLQRVTALSARDGLEMVYLQRCEGRFTLLSNPVGSRIPIAIAPSGWAYLAGLENDKRQAVLKEIAASAPRKWPRIRQALTEALRDYEGTGYIVSTGVLHEEITAVAVPVRSKDGRLVLGLSCSGLRSAWTAEQIKQVGAELIELARKLAPSLSGPSPAL
jgi:DNA-binding IclR family transcriptional regulator